MNKKKALAALLVFTVVFIIVYLLAAFVNLDFDLRKWDVVSRVEVVILGSFVGTVAAVFVYLWEV